MQRNGSGTSSPAATLRQATSMSEASLTCEAMISPDTRNVTFSPASADGRSRSGSQDGPTTDLFGQAVPRARTQVLRAPSGTSGLDSLESGHHSSDCGLISSLHMSRAKSCLKMCPVSARGFPKSRDVWRALATEFADPNERLRMLVRLIFEGACGLLPTVTARDGKNPGRADHARLSATRGEPLPETFGLPVTAALAAWMMGYPTAWLTCAPSATPLTRGLPRNSSRQQPDNGGA